jgi:hypothetical protein
MTDFGNRAIGAMWGALCGFSTGMTICGLVVWLGNPEFKRLAVTVLVITAAFAVVGACFPRAVRKLAEVFAWLPWP